MTDLNSELVRLLMNYSDNNATNSTDLRPNKRSSCNTQAEDLLLTDSQFEVVCQLVNFASNKTDSDNGSTSNKQDSANSHEDTSMCVKSRAKVNRAKPDHISEIRRHKSNRNRKAHGEPQNSRKLKNRKSHHIRSYETPVDYPTKETDWNQEIKTFCIRKPSEDVLAYVRWKNGKKTTHPLDVLCRKIPKKLLAYYESKLLSK